MVKLEEVTLEEVDEHRQFSDEEEETGSEYSEEDDLSEDSDEEDDEEDDGEDDETLMDRVYALRDIIPPTRRAAISKRFDILYNGGAWITSTFGKTLWVVATTALVLVVPLAIEIEKEQAIIQYEEEMKAQQAGSAKLAGGSLDGASLDGLKAPGF